MTDPTERMPLWGLYLQKRDGIVAAVRSRPEGKKISIKKNTPSHQIHNHGWKADCHRVDVSSLNEVLGYEQFPDPRTGERITAAVCEGQVTMGALARRTLADQRSVPRCVPELSTFTCAGLINGEGIQTSAFKWGVFSHTVMYLEVVLGNGELRRCSRSENSELFAFLMESQGTLGIVTLVAVALTPALPFVRSTYLHYTSLSDFIPQYERRVRAQQGAFLEGLVLAKDSYLIIESAFASQEEAAKGPVFHPSPEEPTGTKWYYQYIRQDVVCRGKVRIQQDFIPTWEFLFRPMRGVWWLIECLIDFSPLYNNRVCRRMIDKKVESGLAAKGGFEPAGPHFTREDENRCYVLQDMGLRLGRLAEGIMFVQNRLGVYPLWLCAVDASRSLKRSPEYMAACPPEERDREAAIEKDGFVVDIGIYGEPTVRPFRHKRVLRDLWAMADAPSTWGVSYVLPEVLRAKNLAIRQKYHAVGVFPGLDEKVTYKGSIEDNIDEEAITCWRLLRDYGPHWRIKFPLFVLAFLTAVGLVLYAALAFLSYLITHALR